MSLPTINRDSKTISLADMEELGIYMFAKFFYLKSGNVTIVINFSLDLKTNIMYVTMLNMKDEKSDIVPAVDFARWVQSGMLKKITRGTMDVEY
jgi:hypothetical protein